jgi:hypothetical protein
MSHQESCSFCTRLPVLRGRTAGDASRCPLCKGELVVARDSGAVFRVTGPVARGGSGRFAAWVIAAAPAVLVVVGISYVGVRGLTNAERAREVARQAEPKLPPSRTERPMTPAPPPVTSPAPAEKPAAAVVVEQARPEPVTQAPPPKPAVIATRPAVEPVAAPARPAPQSDRDLLAAHHAQLPSDFNLGDEQLAKLLREVPEIALDADRHKAKDEKEALAHAKELVKGIQAQTQKDADGFVANLEKKRPDLAGLALRKGKECRLDAKTAQALSVLSLSVRSALFAPGRGSDSAGADSVSAAYNFWSRFSRHMPEDRGKSGKELELPLRTLEQVLQAESAALRLSLVERVRTIRGQEAGGLLARRVLFDPDWQVRTEALLALKGRPQADYAEVLLDGLRHPWAPAAAHAAEAIAGLGMKESTYRLTAMLDAPEPCEPFVQKINGKDVPVVRELVRVNHLHNCLLCHAPVAEASRDRSPVGPVPVPHTELPPPQLYYGKSRGLMVRADVTYLRQDFSVMQPVDNRGKWPAQQRFDFVVRTRPLTEVEWRAWEKQRSSKEPRQMSLHRMALVYALGEVVRQQTSATPDGGIFVPWVSGPAVPGRVWRGPCLK